MADVPLVSCIMPTRDRPTFASQAIWYFLRQDYPNKELVIVDDGTVSIADRVPQTEQIRYIFLSQSLPLGAKRNLACEQSRGELIAHWDDDDWMASDRLSYQVKQLAISGKAICGTNALLYYRLEAGDAWFYTLTAGLSGGTLLYQRQLWADHLFPAIAVQENQAFVRQIPAEQIHCLSDSTFYVALIHSGNTSGRNLNDSQWQRRSLAEVNQRLAQDQEFYIALRQGSALPVVSQPTALTIAAPYLVYDGYGSMAEHLVLGLARSGVRVNVQPFQIDRAGLSQEFLEILDRSTIDPTSPTLCFCWPGENFAPFRRANGWFLYTMCESSRLPARWVAALNQARLVIVPSQFVQQAFAASGVTVPIAIVPQGIDPDLYHEQERPSRKMTTLIVGVRQPRKNIEVGVAAWQQAFADDPEARLIIKTRFQQSVESFGDPRIECVDTNETTRGIAHWYQQADVLLALGNEGFGLPLIEAMATGLPAIALNAEGQADVCAAAPDCLLTVDPVRWESMGDCGVRGVPAVEAVAEQLRWVSAHRAAARQMGQRAAIWVRQYRTVGAMAAGVLEAIESHSRSLPPLRRTETVWVPSWRSPCGIAEYVARMQPFLPTTRITSELSDWRGIRLLHLQHEHSLFGAAELTQVMQQARRRRIPIAITEHTILPIPQPWEQDASAIVSLTRHGAQLRQQQWPTKRVEYIPHGCSTWFPPRKSARGQVIGAFGFLETYKGFWRLLEVLRALPGTELLLFSHAKRSTLRNAWAEAIADLPVRWVQDYLSEVEIAQRLAAEADLLAFWYDEIPHASTSGAVRAGLATGVPVLASPTSWFRDLQEVTYQPQNLVTGVAHLLEDTALRQQITQAAHDYCHAHCWREIAKRHQALWQTLE